MVILKFKNEDQAKSVAGVIDFSVNLIDLGSAKKVSSSIYDLCVAIKKDLLYQRDENVLYIKEKEVIFSFENAIWILGQEIKEKKNEIYSNSIGLMKEILSIIQQKKKDNFIIKEFRKFDPELLEFYNENLSQEFLITKDFEFKNSLNIPENQLPKLPKKNEIYILKKYIPFIGKSEIGPIEDSLLIINKLTNIPIEISPTDFNRISILKK